MQIKAIQNYNTNNSNKSYNNSRVKSYSLYFGSSLDSAVIKTPKSVEESNIPKFISKSKIGQAFLGAITDFKNSSLEKAMVFKKDDASLIAKSEINSIIGCDFLDISKEEILNHANKGQKPCLIHSHKVESTLSSLDIQEFFDYKYDMYMATTPSGGYSILYRTKPALQIAENSDLGKDILRLETLETAVAIKMFRKGLSDLETWNNIDKFKHNQIKKLVKKYNGLGLKYEYKKGKIDPSTLNQVLPELDYLKNPQNAFLEQGYTKKESDDYLQMLDKTSLRKFYLDYKANA